MGDEEPDYSALPLTERWTHKIWKVRKAAYEDAAKQFSATADESDAIFRPFIQDSGLWKGAVTDSNVAAQQDGITALSAFLKFGGQQACTRSRNQTIVPLVEKGLTSTRAATKAAALEAILLYIELDTAAPIVEDLQQPLSNKQPKIIAAALSALTSVYHNFGCHTVDPKPVLKALPKVFGHADKNVRAEATNLAVELYRWLKDAMKPIFWNDLKEVQQKDLEAQFEKVKADPPPKQERLLRSQAAQASQVAAAEEAVDDAEEAEAVEIDIFDPVDVMPKVPKDLQENLASTKWKDRKEALDALYIAVNVPKIKEGDFGEIVRSLAKCMKDANVTVVSVAANCVEALAKGLRRSFGRYRSIVMGPMMERLKEKKQLVTDALSAALDAVFASTNLSDCLEEILEFTKHKNPQVKLESVRLLIRCLRTTKDVPAKPEQKQISDAATKLLTESSEVLRSSAAEVLGTLMKILGERAMNPYLDALDDIRKTKIKEYFETAEVKAKEKPKPVVAPPPAKSAPAGKKPVGKRPAPGLKRPASTPAPPAEELPPTPSQRPAARAIPSKMAGPGKSGISAPTGGLKLQRKLAGPGGSAPPNTASPRRAAAPTAAQLEEEPALPPPKLGLAGRGLAGRPLGRPTPSAPVSEPVVPTVSSHITAAERAELDELRAEVERLRRHQDDSRTDRSKLTSQIHELQNQNAQLIEDHTRDVLSIKAKETQLVRARSDAEAAEQMCQKQQREMERLKRELTRAVRATSPGPADVSEQIYRDAGLNGVPHGGAGGYAPNRYGGNKRMSFASSLSEEKENGDPDAPGVGRNAKLSPTLPYTSGMTSPPPGDRRSPVARGARERDRDAGASGGNSSSNNGDGIESWKRAAEVTSQLKARIEQMKAKQGISRP